MRDDEPRRADRVELAAFGAAKVAAGIEQGQLAKFHGPGGHGFAAEDANALADRLRGRSVKVVGTSNRLNGADRVVDGVLVQTKYHATAAQSVDAAFEVDSGRYRYPGQQLEVPADQYDEAVALVEQRIREGRVAGATHPDDARTLVRRGAVTYRQARNIARAGTIESLTYDAATQVVTTSHVLAISFLVALACERWNGKRGDDAVRSAMRAALATGATSFVAGVVTAQVLRLRGAAIGATVVRTGVRAMANGPVGGQVVERLAQASLGRAVYGAAATSHVARLLRTNLVTAAVATAVTTAPDFYRAALARSVSWPQFTKNLFVNATGVGAGTAGFLVGSVIGLPFGGPIGVALFGLGGALLGGMAGSSAAKAVADRFVEDDAERMMKVVRPVAEELVTEYLLSEREISEFAAGLRRTVTVGWGYGQELWTAADAD